MRRLLISILAALWPLLGPSLSLAEPFPAYQSLAINDFADLLSAETETRIATELDDLRARTGIEMTVVTLASRSTFDAAPSLEAFATRLFNGWGIGNATRNDGILILVLAEDREMRIELGAGYNSEYDIPAQDIVNRIMLPAFREGRMAEGIEAGAQATIRDIAERHAEGMPPAEVRHEGKPWWITPFVVVAFAAIAWRALKDQVWRMMGRGATCPSCGHRGLNRTRQVDQAATRSEEGFGRRFESCPSCGWNREERFTLPRRSSSSGGSFGGGRSSGGGASGRW